MRLILPILILLVIPSFSFSQKAAEKILYNGIVLPQEWPPRSGDPKSANPMAVPYLDAPPEIIPIHVGRQLFVDNFLIESTDLQRVFHAAEKLKENPVFKAETDAELSGKEGPEPGQQAVTYLGHGGVFFDPDGNHFKMFYTAGWRGGLALATSRNLIEWNRPQPGVYKENIVIPEGWQWAGGDNSVWLDVNAKNALDKYKYLTDRGYHSRGGSIHSLHVSGDGKIWSQGALTNRAGDYCSVFYNPFRNVWVYSIKKDCPRGRARYYYEHTDFMKGTNWDESVYWVNADKLDLPDPEIGDSAQLYSLNAVAYESILLGEFYIHLGPDNRLCDKGKFPKITELKLGYSRDGFHWDRPDRTTFIAASRKEGDWDRAYVHGTTGVCAVMGDKIWFPYCAYSGIAPNGTKGMYTGASIGMATLRRDGFASMENHKGKGYLLTRPVTFNGRYLFVNVDCPDGELRVEILDESNKVIAPFTMKKCVPVSTDKTLQMIEWEDGTDLSGLKGQAVKFRFQLAKGKLYSFWVSPDKSGASYGYVGAGGPGFKGVIDDKGIDTY